MLYIMYKNAGEIYLIDFTFLPQNKKSEFGSSALNVKFKDDYGKKLTVFFCKTVSGTVVCVKFS